MSRGTKSAAGGVVGTLRGYAEQHGTPDDFAQAIQTVEAMAEVLEKAHAIFSEINRDTDGDEFLNLSCDGMDLLEPLIAAYHGSSQPRTNTGDQE